MASSDKTDKCQDGMDFLVDRVLRNVKDGDSEDFLRVTEDFCSKNEQCTNASSEKGLLLDKVFKESDPIVAVQLGSFIGYNTVRMARMMKSNGKLYVVEVGTKYADIVRRMTTLTGLNHKVVVINESTETGIPTLKAKYGIHKIDFLFIRHKRSMYKADLMKVIEAGLLGIGSMVVADKVASDDASEYLGFVRNSPRFISKYLGVTEHSRKIEDGFEKSVFVG